MTRQCFTRIIDGLLRPTKLPAYQTLAEAVTADIPKPAFRVGMPYHTCDALSPEALLPRTDPNFLDFRPGAYNVYLGGRWIECLPTERVDTLFEDRHVASCYLCQTSSNTPCRTAARLEDERSRSIITPPSQ